MQLLIQQVWARGPGLCISNRPLMVLVCAARFGEQDPEAHWVGVSLSATTSPHHSSWYRMQVHHGGGGKAQPLNEWHSPWRHDKKWLEPTRPKMAEDSTSTRPWASFYTHCNTSAKWHTYGYHSSEADHKRPKSGQWHSSWKSPPLPQNKRNNPPTR